MDGWESRKPSGQGFAGSPPSVSAKVEAKGALVLDCDRGSPNAKRFWEWHLWMISCGLVGSIADGMGWDSQLSLSSRNEIRERIDPLNDGGLNTASFISYVRTGSTSCLVVEYRDEDSSVCFLQRSRRNVGHMEVALA